MAQWIRVTSEILRLLRQSVSVLEEVASKIRPAHVLARIAAGLRQLLVIFEEARHRADQMAEVGRNGATDVDMSLPDVMHLASEPYDWAAGMSMDGSSLGNYDFLSNPHMIYGFEMWPIDSGEQQFLHDL
jgi:hypothetical protein